MYGPQQLYFTPLITKSDGYHCCEQYMMAQKATLFNDDEILNAIMGTSDPREIKAYGRQVKNFDAKVWDEICREIVFEANYAKFSQNPKLKEFLLSTGDEVIAEASPYDTIWGIGLKADDPLAQNEETWKGKNYLGKAIMAVRKELSNGNKIAL
jgi:hypothetical protein